MKKHIVTVACAAGSILVGCAAEKPKVDPPVYVEAQKERVPPPAPKVVAVPVAAPLPGQLRPAPRIEPPDEEAIAAASINAQGREVWEVIEEANAGAKANPIEEGFFNAVQVYDYAPGVLYQVYAAPMKLTAVQFAEGEKVISVACGDTVRWVVGQTNAGEASAAKEMVLIKPVRSGLHTNMVVTTNRRVYQLELHSYRETYMASVSWHYPYELVQRHAQEPASSAAEPTSNPGAGDVSLGMRVEDLNFGYGFVVADRDDPPSWLPLRVYDDGRKTYVQFPSEVRHRELPALFVLSKQGTPQIVNYRVRGDYMVVDRVFELAQLRLGEDDPVTVGIERLGDER